MLEDTRVKLLIQLEMEIKARKTNEYLLNQAQEVAGLGSWHLDFSTDLLTWSDETYRIFGREKGEALNMPMLLDQVHFADRSQFLSAWEAALKGAPYDIEHRIIVSGKERWVREKAKISFDDAQNPVEAIGMVHDITEKKRYEIMLQVERDMSDAWNAAAMFEDKLALCLGSAIQISSMDCGGVYLIDETSGDFWLAAHQGLSSIFVEKVRRFRADSHTAQAVWKGRPIYSLHKHLSFRQKDLHIFENLQAVAVVPIAFQGRVFGCLNVASHALTETSEHGRIALERIARYSASFIAHAMIEEKNRRNLRDVENLFDTILEMAREDTSPKNAAYKFISAAYEASQRAADMSKLMLTFLGHLPGTIQFFDLSDICRNTLFRLQEMLPASISLKTNFPMPGPVVKIDADQFGKVLESLIVNAIEAIGDFPGELGVSVGVVNGSEIVRDNVFPVNWEPRNYCCSVVSVKDGEI